MFIFKTLFLDPVYILCLIFLFFAASYSYYQIRYGYNLIDESVLKVTEIQVKLNISALIVFTSCLFYIFGYKVMMNLNKLPNFSDTSMFHFLHFLLEPYVYFLCLTFIISFLTLNYCPPVLILAKLLRNKNTLKK
jgi:hypothetical protein